MSTIFILLDAFRADYLDEKVTPFLWECAQNGEHYQRVEQSLGYCERSEFLTGLRPDETGFFTAVGFDPVNSPFPQTRWLSVLQVAESAVVEFLRLLPDRFGARVHNRLRGYVTKHFEGCGVRMSPQRIPFSWLPYFALTEDRIDHRRSEAFPSPSILSMLESAGRTYCYDTFTALNFVSPFSSDSARLDAVLGDAPESLKDLYLVYISAPDTYGHRHGPESLRMREVLHQLDAELREFVQSLERKSPGNRYMFLGDHGMLPVRRSIDAEKEIGHMLRRVGLRKGRDVIYFLDSTMVRLWAMNPSARDLLKNLLETSAAFGSCGFWMDEAQAAEYRIPWPDSRYGEFLWVADPGVIVFPDFFHRIEPCRGMHGYDPRHPDSQGMCILWGEGISPRAHASLHLTGVFDVLRSSLGL